MRQGWQPDSIRSGQVQEPAIAVIHHTTCFSPSILFLLKCSDFCLFFNLYMKRDIQIFCFTHETFLQVLLPKKRALHLGIITTIAINTVTILQIY